MVFQKGERYRLKKVIRAYILKHKKPFVGHRLAQKWIKEEMSRQKPPILSQPASISAYFSAVCQTMKEEGALEHMNTSKRGDALAANVWIVSKKNI